MTGTLFDDGRASFVGVCPRGECRGILENCDTGGKAELQKNDPMRKCLKIWSVALFAAGCLSACGADSGKKRCEETNPTLETIFARRSVREYLQRNVEAEKIDLLLRAAMSAPSGRDRRPWSFVVVDDRPILDSLAAALPYAKMLAAAPCAIVVCGDSVRQSYWYLDCSAAAENILLAAQSLGLGAVWTAAYPYEERMSVVRERLELPEAILPLCVIPVGYPASDASPKIKYDSTRIHKNRWQASGARWSWTADVPY